MTINWDHFDTFGGNFDFDTFKFKNDTFKMSHSRQTTSKVGNFSTPN